MKIDFANENKSKSDFDFPKLYLDHNERARIVCFEKQPEVEYVHTLKAPAIINGEVVMEKVKNKDGSMTEKAKMDFVGRHICFGQPNILFDPDKGGKDPANCPTCAEAQQNDAIGGAIRRMAMHVVQYKVQPGKFQIQTPFQADLVVWTFTNKTYDQLVDISVEHGGDLRVKDLLLGPCENKMFQNFDIQVGGSTEWLENDERKAFVAQLYKENKLDNLQPAIARKISREMAQEDIQKVLLKNAQAYGSGGAGAAAQMDHTPAPAADGLDLDALLSTPSAPAAVPPAVVAEPVAEIPQNDLALETLEVPPAPVAAVSEPEPAPVQEEKKFDIDDLLSGL